MAKEYKDLVIGLDIGTSKVMAVVAEVLQAGDAFGQQPATGKRVMACAADSLKRVTLELGGNDAAIVLDDVDPAAAAQGIFMGAFFNSGQIGRAHV